ncbi:MAG TPA: DUF4249 domain-containing protein [Chitinophagaceae bacterium]|nr:DUF4249 domain-containing protein [Chitinophagaceae bacterium]
MKHLCCLITATLTLISCEKAVTFELEEPAPKLVVEATIETGELPVVILTRSQNYFAQITADILAASFVHNGEVYMSNGTVTNKFKEDSVMLPSGDHFYYYSPDPSNPSTVFRGQESTVYSLRILAGGKEYLATTRIPTITRRIDSMFSKPAPGSNDPNKAVVMVRATDKPGLGDYIRYFTKRNSEGYFPAFNSVFDDQVIDGSTYEVEVERGVDRTQDLPDDYTLFEKGDTVTVKLCQIDKATFDFWRTMEFSYTNIGNPFGSPTKVLSNISNGALGYFGGYAPQFRTIIIPR